MKIVNLTSHPINVINPDGEEFIYPPSGIESRVEDEHTPLPAMPLSPPMCKSVMGEVTNLPPIVPDTMYIVSGIVKTQCIDRTDLVRPGPLIRDEDGIIRGCEYLLM
jgi:hypothetical protein